LLDDLFTLGGLLRPPQTARLFADFRRLGDFSRPAHADITPFSVKRAGGAAKERAMTFRVLGIFALVFGVLAISQPSFATEPGSKECKQFGTANNCTARWDRRVKACVC
jgi:hypothetical protein